MKTLAFLFVMLVVAGAWTARRPAPADVFEAIDLVIDTGDDTLAAYQVEITFAPAVRLVGIEGGDADAFAVPPMYDPRLLADEHRLVVATFATAPEADLPTGRQRVASLNIRRPADVAAD
ncbi:MAG: hypothetical protein KDA25_00255, partial [Phycisphaerales bacterium]|nr:hypothetical protein [Phycisphaerales bacterium]